MRYRTWRRSVALGAAVLMLTFVVPVFLGGERVGMACEILFWTSLVGYVGFQLAIVVLRRLGILGFSYTEADRNSYLYKHGIDAPANEGFPTSSGWRMTGSTR